MGPVKAIDTNILARFVTRDDPVQAAQADAVLAGGCYIAATVLLETSWLLASYYRIGRDDLAATLTDILRLPGIWVDDRPWVEWAIGRFAAGADLADMLHLVAAHRRAESFVSFERRLATLAGPDTPIAIERPA